MWPHVTLYRCMPWRKKETPSSALSSMTSSPGPTVESGSLLSLWRHWATRCRTRWCSMKTRCVCVCLCLCLCLCLCVCVCGVCVWVCVCVWTCSSTWALHMKALPFTCCHYDPFTGFIPALRFIWDMLLLSEHRNRRSSIDASFPPNPRMGESNV